jgi:HAD superfamily hydrolase (TIGR01662 family)
MDGTLTDTMRLQPYLVRNYLLSSSQRKNLSFQNVQERLAVIYYINKFSWFKLRSFSLFVRQFQISYVKLFFKVPIIITQYIRAIRTKERIFSDVRDSIIKIKESGLEIGLVTNGKEFEVNMKLKSIKNMFDVTVTASDVIKKKPHPEMILKGIKKLRSNPKDTLYVGDTLVDMKAAKNANCSFALMTTGTFGPNVVRIGREKPGYVFSSVSELTDWLITSN